MTPLHPRQLSLLRIRFAVGGLVLLGVLAGADAAAAGRGLLPMGIASGVGLLLVLLAVFLVPRRRFASWGYRVEEDELWVRHGLAVRKLTVVPFGRVQHIDVGQGPIERSLGLATLVLNTAGTRGAAVRLPGLLQATAEELRDHIRGKIRQDLV